MRRSFRIAAAAAVTLVAAGAVIIEHNRIPGLRGGHQAPPAPQAAIDIPVAGTKPINPRTPIVVKSTGGRLTKVVVINPAEHNKIIKGTFGADHTTWTTAEDLGYGSTYSVAADAVNPDGKPTAKTAAVTTVTPASTADTNVVPDPGIVAEVGIGVGQPMVFQFSTAVVNKAEVQKHLHVDTTPPQPGAWYWVDDNNVNYRGPNFWLPGTTIHISADIYGVDLGNGVYAAGDAAANYRVHDSWIAKGDGRTDMMTIFHNGQQVNQMPMSLGNAAYPTHVGPHVISGKSDSVVMDSCTYGVCQGQSGYYRETVYLDERISSDGEFVHSAPWSVWAQGSSNVSHGCVNLSPDNAQWFYDHFGIGDVVDIVNSGGPPLPVWDTYGAWLVPWDVWQVGNATAGPVG